MEIEIATCTYNCALFPIGSIKNWKGKSYVVTRLEPRIIGKAVFAKPVGQEI